jgi:GTP-binding nuclear protein Ran
MKTSRNVVSHQSKKIESHKYNLSTLIYKQQMDTPTFKCVLVGDGCVGKSTFVQKHLTGVFQQFYEPTLGVEVHPLVFKTNKGQIRFNIWDTAGQDRFGGLREGYFVAADCAIIMFDLTDRSTYNHLEDRYRDLIRVCDRMPVVLVGTKADIANKDIRPSEINFHRKYEIKYYEVSSKSNFQFEKPFVSLMRDLMGNQTLTLVN